MPGLHLPLSVIIPTRDRPEAVAACLDSLARQTLPRERYEVIVVVDGGAMLPAGVETAAAKRLQLSVIHQHPEGPAAARNRGASLAKGRWLVFTDDDCLPDATWLSEMRDAAACHAKCVLGGETYSGPSDGAFTRASQTLIDAVLAQCNRSGAPATFFPSNNLAVAADSFQTLGGFSPDYRMAAGEDRDFCRRWLAAGGEVTSVPLARVHHDQRLTFRRFVRQQFRYGAAAHRFRRTVPAAPVRGGRAVRVLGLFGYPMRVASGWRRALLLGLFAVAQLTVGAGYYGAALVTTARALSLAPRPTHTRG